MNHFRLLQLIALVVVVVAAVVNRGKDRPMGDPDDVIRRMDRHLQRRPTDAAAYHNRGAAWHAKKEYDRAIQD